MQNENQDYNDGSNDDVPRYDPIEWVPFINNVVGGGWLYRQVYEGDDGTRFITLTPEPPLPFLNDDEELTRFKLPNKTLRRTRKR